MAVAKTKSIDEIDDIGEMFEAMAALDISSKGLQTLQDMKDRAKNYNRPVFKITQLECRSGKNCYNNSQFQFVICALYCLT